jgi:hypothetical protein
MAKSVLNILVLQIRLNGASINTFVSQVITSLQAEEVARLNQLIKTF